MGTLFVIILLGELPDKSMFATLVLGTRGHRLAVWLGVALAFLVHVVIAVIAGGLLSLLPHPVVAGIAAALFLGGAIYVLREGEVEQAAGGVDAIKTVEPVKTRSHHRMFVTAFLVIFIADWGDITQILIANFAARYSSPIEVGIAGVIALWTVAALAVAASRFLSRLPMTAVRRVSAAIMVVLSAWSALSAAGAVSF
jgi:putative Ca2+/H+ antiporter (TMEM165/GDT1 family)